MPQVLSSRSLPGSRHIRHITLEQPWSWLTEGWRDMCAAPAISFAYGAVFTAIGFILLAGLDRLGMSYLIIPLAMGFTLVGPMAAVGLYEVSRRLERGRPVTFFDSLTAWRRNGGQIALMGMMLMLALIAWTRVAMLLFMMFFGTMFPGAGLANLDDLVGQMLFSPQSLAFLGTGLIIGAGFAIAVFAMSVIAVPMLLDRDVDAMTAVLTSLEAVRHNPRPMLLWAGLIAFLTFVGMLMFFVGLIVTLPLIGHASWHAYRSLVERP